MFEMLRMGLPVRVIIRASLARSGLVCLMLMSRSLQVALVSATGTWRCPHKDTWRCAEDTFKIEAWNSSSNSLRAASSGVSSASTTPPDTERHLNQLTGCLR